MSGEASRLSSESRRVKRQRPEKDDHLQDALQRRGIDLIRRLEDKDHYKIFHLPVPDNVPNYKEIIQNPMDFSTVRNNLTAGIYETADQLRADVNLIWSNCIKFNTPGSIFAKEAQRLRDYARRQFSELNRSLSSIASSNKPPVPTTTTSQSTSQPAPSRSSPSAASTPPPQRRKPRHEKNIFLGPIINPRQEQDQYSTLTPAIRARLETPPEAWLELGRRHRRSSVPPILTREREAETVFGKAYQNFITTSAPAAKRILATILDPDMVQRHDRTVALRGNDVSIQNEVIMEEANGNILLENSPEPVISKKRPRANAAGFDVIEKKLCKLIGKKRAREICGNNEAPVTVSPDAIIELNNALVEQEMDGSFMAMLLNKTAHYLREENGTHGIVASDEMKENSVRWAESKDERLEDHSTSATLGRRQLLNKNYSLIQEMRRLKALAEGHLSEKERREVELTIRKVSTCLLVNLQKIAKDYAPKTLTNPIDVSRAGQVLVESILRSEGKKKLKKNIVKKEENKRIEAKVEKQREPSQNGVKS